MQTQIDTDPVTGRKIVVVFELKSLFPSLRFDGMEDRFMVMNEFDEISYKISQMQKHIKFAATQIPSITVNTVDDETKAKIMDLPNSKQKEQAKLAKAAMKFRK